MPSIHLIINQSMKNMNFMDLSLKLIIFILYILYHEMGECEGDNI